MSGKEKSGTSYTTFFGAQVIRLACVLTGRCSVFEANWPNAPEKDDSLTPPELTHVKGVWSAAYADSRGDNPWAYSVPGEHWHGLNIVHAETKYPNRKVDLEWTERNIKHATPDRWQNLDIIVPLRDPRVLPMSLERYAKSLDGHHLLTKFEAKRGQRGMQPDKEGTTYFTANTVNKLVTQTLDYYEAVLHKLKARHELRPGTTLLTLPEDSKAHQGALLVFKQDTLKHRMHLLVPQFADFFRLPEITATTDGKLYEELLSDIAAALPTALDKSAIDGGDFGKTHFKTLDEELQAVCDWSWSQPDALYAYSSSMSEMELLMRDKYPLTSALFSHPMPSGVFGYPCPEPWHLANIAAYSIYFMFAMPCLSVLCLCFIDSLYEEEGEDGGDC
jgi:hypothetical protein